MLIGEVSSITGLSRDTIRYYEKLGLIKVQKKSRRENNYKEYSEETIERLEIIKRAKHLGFTLKEIEEFMYSWLTKSLSDEERVSLFENRIRIIDQKIDKLNEVKAYIQERIGQILKKD
ncbi:MAG: MerR family transcriptional regulator [Bacteroidota bacterium]|nr:MerR family transcriptional regulator [Bacteroidota bacterium]